VPKSASRTSIACRSLVSVTTRTVEGVLAWAADIATALSGDGRDDARLRLISRCVAAERARLAMIEAMNR
jgi:hypothetical protein